MEDRKLASIEVIRKLEPIPGADRIEKAVVKGWNVVVPKGQFKENDRCVFFEIDSILPFNPWNDFLRNKDKPQKPIRLKTIRMKKQISQGLALRVEAILGDTPVPDIGYDLTEELGIIKYVAEIPACLSGTVKGSFPSFLQKTDEERIQNLPEYFDGDSDYCLIGKTMYMSEKIDGSSGTFYNKDGEFGVCSRNLELKETEGNVFWEIAKRYKLQEILEGKNICIQGEVAGLGIQSNPLKLENRQLFVFNVYDIDKGTRLSFFDFMDFCAEHKLPIVPILGQYVLPMTIDSVLKEAEGKSKVYNMAEREGVVFRLVNDSHVSFKAISNKYLLKTGN